MNSFKNKSSFFAIGVLLGSIITASVIGLLSFWDKNLSSNNDGSNEDTEKKPLYWVAPMDPNFKKDSPGKSPMGMDLVPVYQEDESNIQKEEGAVKISPTVINNLGVKTDLVKKSELSLKIVTVGYVKYDEDKLIHIHPRVSGWIEKLSVKSAGDPVIKGEPLYEIYSHELINAQEELFLAMQRKNQSLVDAAEARLRSLQLSQENIDKIKRSRQVQHNVTFFAPQNGVVDNLNIREGFFVKPGTTLMSIGDLSNVWVEAEIFERQAAWVKVNDLVTMTLGYLPGKEWQGKVDYIYPTLNEKTRTVKLRLCFENKERLLKPNMFAQIVIHSENSESALLVPHEAIIRTGQQNRVVLVLNDNQFKSVEVNLGKTNGEYTEVLSGLYENDKIVTSAQFLIDSESSKTSDFKRMEKAEIPSESSMQYHHHNMEH